MFVSSMVERQRRHFPLTQHRKRCCNCAPNDAATVLSLHSVPPHRCHYSHDRFYCRWSCLPDLQWNLQIQRKHGHSHQMSPASVPPSNIFSDTNCHQCIPQTPVDERKESSEQQAESCGTTAFWIVSFVVCDSIYRWVKSKHGKFRCMVSYIQRLGRFVEVMALLPGISRESRSLDLRGAKNRFRYDWGKIIS